jgi:hypothetical protein
MNIEGEGDIAALCLRLLGQTPEITIAEWTLAKSSKIETRRNAVDKLREQIRTGSDPLGDAFVQLRSAEQRRPLGAIYTPEIIVAAMIRWAAEHDAPTRIVDPGAGSGRFVLAAADAFPDAKLVAIERDPLAALMLRANLAARGMLPRATIIVGDYCTARIGRVQGRSLFIGNPPYVRHHQIEAASKLWFGEAAKALDVPASKLSGLHIHFYLRTAQLARPGDFGTFITSSEWLDVNYGKTLRHLLAGKLGGTALHVLDAKALPFAGAMTTGAITCFHVGARPPALKVRAVKSLDKLNGLSSGKPINWSDIEKLPRWSVLLRAPKDVPAGYVELGELCRVHRGQVTGSNAVWIDGPHARSLPDAVKFPTITRGRELSVAGDAVATVKGLRRVIDLPTDLDELSPHDRRVVMGFLEFAKANGAHESYIARHRRAWWSVGLKDPAPILVSYMARRAPSFARNLCGARHINIAHGLYPREKFSVPTLDALAKWLRENVSVESGRTYAGGLTKFEPKEIERIPVPLPESLLQ